MSENRKIVTASIIIGLIISLSFGFLTKAYSDTIQGGIAKEVIRFHVLANSDSDEDQALKLKVRDEILNKYRNELSQCENISQTRKILQDNMDQITECAREVIKAEGYDYGVTACLSRDMFPTKTYGDISFPAGEYEALRVVIGKGEGHNWWCVMFPPLCFVDVTHSEIPEKEKNELKNILTDEEYDIVTTASSDASIPVKIKFKIVELWQEKFL